MHCLHYTLLWGILYRCVCVCVCFIDIDIHVHTKMHTHCFVGFRYDLLQISYGSDNNTLIARATNVGQTVLKVGRSVCMCVCLCVCVGVLQSGAQMVPENLKVSEF